MDWSRREFLHGIGAGFAASVCPMAVAASGGEDAEARFVREARHWERLDDLRVRCTLCPRRCVIADTRRGRCGVRENRGGTFYTLVHSRACTVHIDPIEKKPFFHVLPGTGSYSLATAGCNIECRFCQNWEISQSRPEQVRASYLPPERVVRRAAETNCRTIAFTYSEPVVFFEYMVDCARAAQAEGIRGVMVSNGYIAEPAMREACEVLGAVKIDLKGFTEKYYRETCGGRLQPVLDTLGLLKKLGMWTEIVVLLVPGMNDGAAEIDEMTRWIAGELGPDVPVHFSRFHPTYKMRNLPPTPRASLEAAWETGKRNGLHFVYIGNLPGHPAEQTLCPGCGKALVRRYGFHIIENRIANGGCPDCGRGIPGIWT